LGCGFSLGCGLTEGMPVSGMPQTSSDCVLLPLYPPDKKLQFYSPHVHSSGAQRLFEQEESKPFCRRCTVAIYYIDR